MRNFYFNGQYLFDHMTSEPIVDLTTPTTTPSDRHRWRDFDGYSWIMYDLELLPREYHRRSYREAFEVIFRTSRPDGLIWYTGNERDNMHLSMKVGYTHWPQPTEVVFLTPSTPAVPNCYCSKCPAPYWSNPPISVWHSGALALSPERQSARMSKIRNSGLDQYGKV